MSSAERDLDDRAGIRRAELGIVVVVDGAVGARGDHDDALRRLSAACADDGRLELVVVAADQDAIPHEAVVVVGRESDRADRIAAGAARVRAPRCLVVSSHEIPSLPTIRRHASAPAGCVSFATLPNPVDTAPPTPAGAVLARRRGVAAPTDLLVRNELSLVCGADDVTDDVAGAAVATLAALADLPLAAVHDERPWTVGEVVEIGRDAVALHRLVPTTAEQSGLTRYRSVGYRDYVIRRLASALPRAAVCRLTSRRRLDAAFWHGVRRGSSRAEWRSLSSGTTVLMYHAFAPEGASRYVVSRRRLRAQLRLIRALRRRVVSLDAYVTTRLEHGLPPARATVITIDDGYADAFDVAAPEFRRAGVCATLFVPSAHVGGRADWTAEPALAGRQLATWAQLSDRSTPIDIGSHSAHHVALDSVDADTVERELDESARVLAQGTGKEIVHFAYPYGAEDADVRAAVERSSYRSICTSHGGVNTLDDPVTAIRRVEIRGDAPWWHFVFAVTLGTTRPLASIVAAFRS